MLTAEPSPGAARVKRLCGAACAVVAAWGAACGAAQAQATEGPHAEGSYAQSDEGGLTFTKPTEQSQPPSPSAVKLSPPGKQAKEKGPAKVSGALTSVIAWGPEYLGARDKGVSVEPGFLLRYGRWTLSSNGSFADRPDNEYPRGMGLELFSGEEAWVRLSLRVDSGRRSKGIDELQGIDDVRRTLRMRLSARTGIGGGWYVTPGVNVDVLNRGGGQTADLQLSRDWKLSDRLTWNAGSGVTWGNGQYIRSYFGVTPAESLASGYAVYHPHAGLRDVWVGTGLRYELGRDWVITAHTAVQHLVGPAADSPLTHTRTHWGASAGIGWRF